MRATFSIDEPTDAALRRIAVALRTSKSEVVRRAILELEAGLGRLTEGERRRKLAVIERLRSQPPSRSAKAVERELVEIRRGRRSGWRHDE